MKQRTLKDVYRACLSDLVMQAPEGFFEEHFLNQKQPTPSGPPEEVIRQVGDAALKEVLEEMKQEKETIVDDEVAFPDYALPKKTTGRKKRRRKSQR